MNRAINSRVVTKSRAVFRQFSTAVETTTLPNGMRVASVNTGGSTASVGLYVDSGSRFSPTVPYLLEKSAFKGKEETLEGLGASMKVTVAPEITEYSLGMMSSDLSTGVSVLSGVVTGFDPASVAAEKEGIMQSIEDKLTLEEEMFDSLHEIAFRGTPLSIPKSQVDFEPTTAADVKSYLDSNYTAPRMVLAAAGSVNHSELVGLAEKAFADIGSELTYETEPSLFSGCDKRVYDDDLTTNSMIYGFEGVPATDSDYLTVQLITSILGEFDAKLGGGLTSSSKLCQEIARENLAYTCKPFAISYSDTGIFGMHVTCPPGEATKDLSYHLQEEMVRLVFTVSGDDLSRAQAALKTKFASKTDNNSLAFAAAEQLISLDRTVPLQETMARIDAITASDVNRVAERLVWDQEVAVVIVGAKLKGFPDYNQLRRRTYWNRY